MALISPTYGLLEMEQRQDFEKKYFHRQFGFTPGALRSKYVHLSA